MENWGLADPQQLESRSYGPLGTDWRWAHSRYLWIDQKFSKFFLPTFDFRARAKQVHEEGTGFRFMPVFLNMRQLIVCFVSKTSGKIAPFQPIVTFLIETANNVMFVHL